MIPLLKWWLILEVLGLVGLPIVAWLFPSLKDRGMSLSIPVGLLMVAYPVWLLSHLGPFFGAGAILLWLFVFGGAAIGLFLWEFGEWRQVFRKPWEILLSKAVWLASFFLLTLLRSYNPDIVGMSNWGGCEKFMDLNFVNGILGSSEFPPHDGWLAGFPINYYYYGYYLCALLVKLTGVLPHVGYNLMLVTVYALAIHGAWGLLRNLGVRWYWVALAIYVAFLATNLKAGNLAWTARGIEPQQAMGTSRVIDVSPVKDETGKTIVPGDHTINEYPLFTFSWGDLHGHLSGMALQMGLLGLCWGAVVSFGTVSVLRQICGVLPIALVYGSLVVTNAWDLPAFAVVVLFGLLSATSLRKNWKELLIAAGTLGLTASLLGLRQFGVPLQAVFAAVSIVGFFLLALSRGFPDLRLGGHLGLRLAAILAVFSVLFFPFFAHFVPPTSGVNRVPWDLKSPMGPFLQIFGVHFALLTIPLLGILFQYLLETVKKKDKLGSTSFHSTLYGSLRWCFLAMVLAGWASGSVLLIKKTGSFATARTPVLLLGFLALGAIWLIHAWWRDGRTKNVPIESSVVADRYVSFLFILAVGLILGCEFVAVKDFYGTDSLRMNTVFKFHLQAWLLLAVAIAFSIDRFQTLLMEGLNAHRERWPAFAVPAILQVALVLVAIGWTGYGSWEFLKVMSSDFERKPTLDGIAHAVEPGLPRRELSSDDAKAILWLLDEQRFHPDPQRRILEVPGNPYSVHGRVSAFSGVPALLGWPNHENIWNDQKSDATPEIRARQRDANEIYRTRDFRKARELLEKYKITHVFWGSLEKAEFGASAGRKFQKYMNVAKQYGGTLVLSGYKDVPVDDDSPPDLPPQPLSGARAIQDPEHPLQELRGAAVGVDGSIYVCNSKKGTVTRFDREGRWIQDFGQPGSTPNTGELSIDYSGLGGVTVDAEGTVYVTDTWNHRIAVFAPDGKYLREFKPGFWAPRDVLLFGGDLVVSDTGNHRLLVLGPTGTVVRTVGTNGRGPGEFTEPVGLCVLNENLYVADVGNGRVQVFGPTYRFLFSFDVLGWEDQVWTEPYLAADSQNRLWLTDSGGSRLERFTAEGKLNGLFGPSCPPVGDLKNAKGLACFDGTLILSDFGNNRLVLCSVPE